MQTGKLEYQTGAWLLALCLTEAFDLCILRPGPSEPLRVLAGHLMGIFVGQGPYLGFNGIRRIHPGSLELTYVDLFVSMWEISSKMVSDMEI